MQVARHVGVRAPIARLSFPRIPLNVKPLDPLRARPRGREPRDCRDGRRRQVPRRGGRRPGGCTAHTPRGGRGRPPPLSSSLSISLSVRPERTYRSFRRPYTMCGCALDEWHPRYYSLHSEAASSGKELLGRLSLWRVQVDRGHRPLGAVVGLASPARLCRGSRAVSRKLPTGQLPTGAL